MFEKILVCLDGSKAAERILPLVTEEAVHFGSKVTLLRVISLPGTYVPLNFPGEPSFPIQTAPDVQHTNAEQAAATEYLVRITASLQEQGMNVDYAVIAGIPGQIILDYIRENDMKLVALGTHGHGGLRRAVLGSTADYVIRYAEIPVLIVRPAER